MKYTFEKIVKLNNAHRLKITDQKIKRNIVLWFSTEKFYIYVTLNLTCFFYPLYARGSLKWIQNGLVISICFWGILTCTRLKLDAFMNSCKLLFHNIKLQFSKPSKKPKIFEKFIKTREQHISGNVNKIFAIWIICTL